MTIIAENKMKKYFVRDVLNKAGGKVGNALASLFSESAKLDMWSKFKPMIIDLIFVNLWDKRDSDKYYYQGKDGKCGLTYTEYKEVELFKDALTKGETAWGYTPPKGGEIEPHRFGDFRRYNTNAINPVGNIPANLIATRSASSGDSVQIDIEINVPTGSDYNLGITDFHVEENIPFSDMYMGVYLVNSNGVGRFRTSTEKVGENDTLSIVFPLNYGEGGEYTAYTFLSTTIQGDNAQKGTFVSIGKTCMDGIGQKVTIKPVGTTYMITAIASAEPGTKNFYYEVHLKNNNSGSTTFEDVYMQLTHDVGQGASPESWKILLAESVVVESGGTKIFTGTREHSVVFDMDGLNRQKFGIFAYTEVPELRGEIMPIEPMFVEEE